MSGPARSTWARAPADDPRTLPTDTMRLVCRRYTYFYSSDLSVVRRYGRDGSYVAVKVRRCPDEQDVSSRVNDCLRNRGPSLIVHEPGA